MVTSKVSSVEAHLLSSFWAGKEWLSIVHRTGYRAYCISTLCQSYQILYRASIQINQKFPRIKNPELIELQTAALTSLACFSSSEIGDASLSDDWERSLGAPLPPGGPLAARDPVGGPSGGPEPPLESGAPDLIAAPPSSSSLSSSSESWNLERC